MLTSASAEDDCCVDASADGEDDDDAHNGDGDDDASAGAVEIGQLRAAVGAPLPRFALCLVDAFEEVTVNNTAVWKVKTNYTCDVDSRDYRYFQALLSGS